MKNNEPIRINNLGKTFKIKITMAKIKNKLETRYRKSRLMKVDLLIFFEKFLKNFARRCANE